MEHPTIGHRVIIVGCPGSGKSTLARKLHARTGLPLYCLDNVWWKADRTHITRDEFDNRLRTIMQGERWIIEGNYSRTLEMRFLACDTVIFLDYSEDVCMKGITERIGTVRPDIPWTESRLDPELAALVRGYRTENRPELYALMEKYSDKQIIILRTRDEADAWLSSLSGTV